MDKALPSTSQAGYGQLMKMLITLKLHQIFESNFAYLFILRCPGTRMQNSDELFFKLNNFSINRYINTLRQLFSYLVYSIILLT